MDRTSPDTIKEVEAILEKKLSLVMDEGVTNVGGVDPVVAILNEVDRSTEKQIIETLEMDNPELTDEIKRKMFVFEDVVLVDDRGIQKVIKEVDMKDLALALKASGDEVKNKFVRNMSKRSGQMLLDDMEFLGPVRLRDVEDAQQKIVNIIRKLEDQGEVIVSRGGADDAII
jgi:flagellar motor switch protein FliG